MHLVGRQEFGVIAYVKDNSAGKPDARARIGWFVGYDTESKGFRVNSPENRTVSIERNVIFNKDNVTVVIQGDQIGLRGRRTKSSSLPKSLFSQQLQNPKPNLIQCTFGSREHAHSKFDSVPIGKV
jgi:hypothetical protein